MIKRHKVQLNNYGITMIEMIVSFALLAIFLVAASMFISSITSLYYSVKGETYARQVSDILMQKIESEIDGAKFGNDEVNSKSNPKITVGKPTNQSVDEGIGDTIDLIDKTDTHIRIFRSSNESNPTSGEIVVHYYPIGSSSAIDWKFDDSVYNGYRVEELHFIRGDQLNSFSAASDYGLDTSAQYGKDVVVVCLKLNSDKYSDFYSYRFIKMYNYKDILGDNGEGNN